MIIHYKKYQLKYSSIKIFIFSNFNPFYWLLIIIFKMIKNNFCLYNKLFFLLNKLLGLNKIYKYL